jgi:uncharacterized protein YdiU (UPF0061 family)
MIHLKIDETFIHALPGDPNLSNERRQVRQACYSFVKPTIPANPHIIHIAKDVADQIGLKAEELNTESFLNIFSGKEILPNTNPFAMAYAGHQFGHWAGQLGDGRAINLTEVLCNNQRFMLQLKGAGPTPYSRSGDGYAVLRSSIREHLCSEAMYYLGIPTTRSLSLISTGDLVARDILYNGNIQMEKGAIVCRVAPSFIRFGNFELLAANKDIVNLKKLADYTIEQFFPEINESGVDKYIHFLGVVSEKTREMILDWQRVGFVHGVMNTDNLSIHGITIDYGPYGWIDGYDEGWTPNTTDNEQKRYRFGNQANIALWNLMQLANALYPLIEKAEPLEEILHEFGEHYRMDYADMMRGKLGLIQRDDGDAEMVKELIECLQLAETDMTIFFRNLSKIHQNTAVSWEEIMGKLDNSFYSMDEISEIVKEKWLVWMGNYVQRLQKEERSNDERMKAMNLVNPKYVLRNYMAQMVIEGAEKGDYALLNEIYELLKNPYDEQMEKVQWFAKRPEWARNKIGSSTLSCSS